MIAHKREFLHQSKEPCVHFSPKPAIRSLRQGEWIALGAALIAGAGLAVLPLTWIVAGVPAIILATLIVLRPQVALLLIVFGVPFSSLREINLGGVTVGATEGLIGLMLAAWIAREIALRPGRRRWPRWCILPALFIGSVSLSALNAVALPFLAKELLKWIEALGVALLVYHTVTPKQSRVIVAGVLLAGIAQAAIGAYQFFTQSGPEFFVLMGRFMRAYGTFEQPNPFAGYLGLIAPLAWALGVSLLSKPPHSKLAWLGLIGFGATAAAIGMSWSRGAWIAFGAALVVVNLFRSRRGALLLAALVAVFALIGLLGYFDLLPRSVVQRMTGFIPFAAVRDVRAVQVSDENYAILERLAHWQAALDMWRDHPWLGVGLGNYEAVYAQYALPKWNLPLGHAHNYYLNIAAETGLIGLLSYCTLWGAAWWQMLRLVRSITKPYPRALALGALGMLTHVSVHNLLDNLWVHNLYIHVAIVLGLALVHRRGAADLLFDQNHDLRL